MVEGARGRDAMRFVAGIGRDRGTFVGQLSQLFYLSESTVGTRVGATVGRGGGRTHRRPAQRDAGLPSDGAAQACAGVRHRRGRASGKGASDVARPRGPVAKVRRMKIVSGKGASDENSFERLPAWLWMPGLGRGTRARTAHRVRADVRDRGRRARVQALELRMDALERQASACQPPQSLWWNANNQGAVLLVLDRAADLTSPLLHEYSYQVDLRLVSVFGFPAEYSYQVDLRLVSVFEVPAQLQVRPESSCS